MTPRVCFDLIEIGSRQFACAQQRTHILGFDRFATHRLEPPHPYQLRNSPRILAIGLYSRRRQRMLHMPRLQQLDRKATLLHRPEQPLRQRPRLKPDPRHIETQRPKPGDRCFRLARHLALPHDLADSVNHTHAWAFQRHVNSWILVHGRPSMMLGTGRAKLRSRDTINPGDDHHRANSRLPRRRPVYPIYDA